MWALINRYVPGEKQDVFNHFKILGSLLPEFAGILLQFFLNTSGYFVRSLKNVKSKAVRQGFSVHHVNTQAERDREGKVNLQ